MSEAPIFKLDLEHEDFLIELFKTFNFLPIQYQSLIIFLECEFEQSDADKILISAILAELLSEHKISSETTVLTLNLER